MKTIILLLVIITTLSACNSGETTERLPIVNKYLEVPGQTGWLLIRVSGPESKTPQVINNYYYTKGDSVRHIQTCNGKIDYDMKGLNISAILKSK
jgi:hypothetical protein